MPIQIQMVAKCDGCQREFAEELIPNTAAVAVVRYEWRRAYQRPRLPGPGESQPVPAPRVRKEIYCDRCAGVKS